MTKYEIIDYLANHDDCKNIWYPCRRYFKILDNYLKYNRLSMIENKNHKNNPPRKYYLEQIVNGFEIYINYESDLFEGRINNTYGELFYASNSFAIPRFFRRLEEANRAGVELNHKIIKDIMMMGEAIFYTYYPNFIPLDP